MSYFLPALLLAAPALAQYTATYDASNLPSSSEEGQYGTNACGTSSSQTSNCQNVYINSVNDFCLWGPPETTSNEGDGTSKIGNVEQIVVSYCLKEGYGTRLIPDGTINGAHFVKVVNDKVSYVQVTGQGDLTKLLIPAGDYGGELDPHCWLNCTFDGGRKLTTAWTGLGNPQGGLVFTNAFTGGLEQTHEWTSFMSSSDFCFRACRDGPNAPGYCEHIYDVLSCGFTIPGSHDTGFDDCLGEPTDEAPGVYDGSTFHQGDPTTPAPHPAGATSQCTPYSTIGGGVAAINVITPSPSASASGGSASIMSASMNGTAIMSSMSMNATMTANSSTSAAPSSSSAMSISRMSSVIPSTTVAPSVNAAAVGSASARPSGGASKTGMSAGLIGMGLFAAFFM